MKRKVSESSLNRGVVFDYGFADMGVMNRKVSEKVVLKMVVSLTMGSLTWL